MGTLSPRISIGLPVYNGEKYLRESIDSILEQSYSHLELIISDNASTDRTEDICRAYAAKDKRIRYFRSRENLGAAWNFNQVVKLSSGEYFKWIAHDDICAPNFILKCMVVLDQQPSVVLCYPRAVDIDEDNKFLRTHNCSPDTQSRRPYWRFNELIDLNHACLPIFGLIRARVLKKTRLIGNYVASDRVLLAELGLWGRFYEVPEILFLHREHPLRSTRAVPDLHARTAWFDTKKTKRIVFPVWRLLMEYFSSIRRPPISRRQRIACYIQLVFWIRKYWKMMRNDVVIACKEILVSSRTGTPSAKQERIGGSK
jgi:glycosyltransferase involved in cell wall biosynthesis